MDEIGVMLSVLNSVKVLVGKDNTQAYRDALSSYPPDRHKVASTSLLDGADRPLIHLT
jgi:hypothetical protein